MRTILRLGLAAAVGVVLGGAAQAQTSSTGGGSTGGSTGGGSSGSSAGQSLGQVMQFQTPTSLDESLGNQIGTSSLNQSNILGRYYANPYFQGRAGAQAGETPGGFGQALYGTSGGRTSTGYFGSSTTSTGAGGTSSGGRTSTGFGGTSTGFGGMSTGFGGAGGRTGVGGTTGFGGATGFGGQGRLGGQGGFTGMGGQGRLGGFGGMGTTNAAQVVPLTRQISYTATLQIPRPAPAAAAARVQTEVRAMLDRSTMIANPAGVQVVTQGPVVVLRGTARDEDEARLIANMIRLTPGVREVRNELQFPVQQP
ncbi:MAG TPA: BON domain-containing protein [Fimbriiglobus sp.]|nr:BON domain-containing protein [Fimbriiglobus sp.]